MDITGSQKVKASREHVFQALLDPNVLKSSIPGCESAEAVDSATERTIKVVVSPSIPGFKGPYEIYIRIGEIEPPARVVLTAEPSSSVGRIKAVCETKLTQEADHTQLDYNAHADIQGKIASVPEFILKGAVKTALDHFFKNLEKYARALPA